MTTTAPRPHVLIAPDKFKGSASALEAAQALSNGIAQTAPDAEVTLLPLADGGDGSVEAALSARHLFAPVARDVSGPFGEPVTATIALSPDSLRAVVEVANTCGLGLVENVEDAAARKASSRGFGEAIAWACRETLQAAAVRTSGSGADGDCAQVVAAIGGSSSTDGGAGVLHELGLRFFTSTGDEFVPSGGDLATVANIEVTERFHTSREALESGELQLVIASDVTNPLMGERGAAAVFGPQKGASDTVVSELERGLAHFVEALDAAGLPASEVAKHPGAGAAGGIGFGLMLAGAELVSGADFFLDLLDFDSLASHATLVVTGEGSLDSQTLDGKLPAVVATRAHRSHADVTVVAIAGIVHVPEAEAAEAGFARTLSLTDIAGRSTAGDPEGTRTALEEAGSRMAEMLAQ